MEGKKPREGPRDRAGRNIERTADPGIDTCRKIRRICTSLQTRGPVTEWEAPQKGVEDLGSSLVESG